jgi:predicted transcriptional regulator
MAKKKLTVELDPDTHDRIVRHAKETERSPEAAAAALIEKALREIDGEPQQSVADLRQQFSNSIARAGRRLLGK